MSIWPFRKKDRIAREIRALPHALASFRAGKRLTFAVQAPRELDLSLRPQSNQ
jgi:hypothetical protein